MKGLRTALCSIVLLSAGCCATDDIIRSDYVKGDRLTFDAITPAYLKYVEEDDTLSEEKKTRRKRTVRTWKLRLENAEASMKAETSKPEGQ